MSEKIPAVCITGLITGLMLRLLDSHDPRRRRGATLLIVASSALLLFDWLLANPQPLRDAREELSRAMLRWAAEGARGDLR